MTAAYSGTPLARKLSLKGGMLVWWDGMPESANERADLEAKRKELLPLLAPAGMIWVSWAKKASKVPTDITEDVIRDVCLPLGLST
jgi:hypothetical protein